MHIDDDDISFISSSSETWRLVESFFSFPKHFGNDSWFDDTLSGVPFFFFFFFF